MRVAVIGAGGLTGLECVKQLHATPDHDVVPIVRDPAKYESKLPQGITAIKGDVVDAASLKSALAGCDAVIYAASSSSYWAPEAVDYKGVVNVADAAKQLGIQRVVLISSCLVTPARRWHPLRILLNNIRYSLMDYKFKGEEALRASGVGYTIVRPGGLTHGPLGEAALHVAQGDTVLGQVSRADVAAVCIAALSSDATKNTTFELVNVKATGSQPPTNTAAAFATLFEGLKRD